MRHAGGMDTTSARLRKDLTASMKARDTFRTGTIRQILAALQTEATSGKHTGELTEEQTHQVLAREVKKRRESADIYTQAGAAERAQNETSEADLIATYLPPVLTGQDLDDVVGEVISAIGATTMKDMGRVMKAVNTQVAASGARVDGKDLSTRVRAALS